MKYRTTAKAVQQGYPNIISVGYCGAYHLLKGIEPKAYTCGVYGWNFDVYEIDWNTAVCTGYRGMPGHVEWDFTKAYEQKAIGIVYNRDLSWEDRTKKVESIRNEWIQKVLEQQGKRC